MDPEVQAAGCATLAVLGRYADNLERIVVDEGMDVLMAAMDNHAENPDVLQEGLFLIYLLARSNAENRRVRRPATWWERGKGGGVHASIVFSDQAKVMPCITR